MRKKLNQLLQLQTRDGQTLVEFSLLFSLIALLGLTIVTAVYDRFGAIIGATTPGP
jgi:hypothetical protein